MVSLVLNVVLVFKVVAIEHSLARAQADFAGQAQSIVARLGNLEYALAQPQEPAWVIGLEETYAPAADGSADKPLVVTLRWGLLEVDWGTAVTVVCLPADGQKDSKEIRATAVGGLAYTATLELDPTRNWFYQIVGTVGGSRRASNLRALDLASKMASSSLIIDTVEYSDKAQTLRLTQQPYPFLEAFRVKSIAGTYAAPGGVVAEVDVKDEGGGVWTVRTTGSPSGNFVLDLTFGDGRVQGLDFGAGLGRTELPLTPLDEAGQ